MPAKMIACHPKPALTGSQEIEFWNLITKRSDDECWEWTGPTWPNGYGCFKVNGTRHVSSRLAFLLTRPGDPSGLMVRHDCDNPICCNPWHLRVGTGSDNMVDCLSRGRHVSQKRHI